MPLYLYTAQYTAEALAAQIKTPLNRAERTREPVERLGGTLIGALVYAELAAAFTAELHRFLFLARPAGAPAPMSCRSTRMCSRRTG